MSKNKNNYRIKYTTKHGGKVELVWEGARKDAMDRAHYLIDNNLIKDLILIEENEIVILKVEGKNG